MAYLTIAIPNTPELVTTAKIVSRALDPDVGGYYAFQTVATDSKGTEFSVYGTPCSDGIAASIQYFKTNPQALVDAVNADIAVRWAGEAELTLADASAFCDAVQLSEAYGIDGGLEDLELTIQLAQ